MALSWILLRTYAAEYPTQPERVFSAVNRRMVTDAHTDQFVTAFYGILDPSSGRLTYCNAGHNPPYLASAQASQSVQALNKTGLPLGVFEDADWKEEIIQLAPGDVLVLYTDGITEAQDSQQHLFKDDRLLACIQANLGRSAHDVQNAILADISEFVGQAPQVDDITLAVILRDQTVQDA